MPFDISMMRGRSSIRPDMFCERFVHVPFEVYYGKEMQATIRKGDQSAGHRAALRGDGLPWDMGISVSRFGREVVVEEDDETIQTSMRPAHRSRPTSDGTFGDPIF
ncbi:hypothetical protein WG66_009665 [Moniliophthora roreri]|nr:hypothetical protein WG66_009665 [Moniliophthora roreri]